MGLLLACLGLMMVAVAFWTVREAALLKATAQALHTELRQFKEGGFDRLVSDKLALLTSQAAQQLETRAQAMQQQRTEQLTQQQQATQTVERLKHDVGAVLARLGTLQNLEAKVGELSDLLKPQQLRGELGEVIVRTLISDALPPGQFEEDYTFRDGKKVEFAIRLKDKFIPIDSKLQLEGFRRLQDPSLDQRQRQTARNEFKRTVRQKIDEVKQYIRPEEGTYDFAFMVIPSEAVFYELVAGREFIEADGLAAYARAQHVFLTSPNTFWAFLSAIAYGLRGLEIERHAEEILSGLQRIATSVRQFTQEEFRILGSHLRNASSQYEAADRKLRDIHTDLGTVERADTARVTHEEMTI